MLDAQPEDQDGKAGRDEHLDVENADVACACPGKHRYGCHDVDAGLIGVCQQALRPKLCSGTLFPPVDAEGNRRAEQGRHKDINAVVRDVGLVRKGLVRSRSADAHLPTEATPKPEVPPDSRRGKDQMENASSADARPV